jgi:hypothetical protein
MVLSTQFKPSSGHLSLAPVVVVAAACMLNHLTPVSVQRVAAEQALKAFQEHPDAWTRVDSILKKAKTQQTKYFALQVGQLLTAWIQQRAEGLRLGLHMSLQPSLQQS